MRDSKGRYKKGFNNQLGRKRSEETKLKMRLAKLGKFAEKTNNWRGGIYPITMLVRRSIKYRIWREEVFKRDNYTCVACGDNKGGNLNADHIEAFSILMQKHGVDSMQAALICQELWSLSNGRTLCVPCHKLTPNFGTKAYMK